MSAMNIDLLFNSWKDKIVNWTEGPDGEAGDKNLSAFSKATDCGVTTSEEGRLFKVLRNTDAVILAATADNKILCLHSLKDLGGTFARPEHKIVALKGLSHDAGGIVLSYESAFSSQEISAAKYQDIKGAANRDELSNLAEVATRSGKLKCCAIVLPPPHIARSVVDFGGVSGAAEFDPIELLEIIKGRSAAFDADHEEELAELEIESSVANCENLIRFLWSVSKGLIEPVVIENSENDGDVSTYVQAMREKFIIPPAGDARRVHFVENQVELLRSQNIQMTAALNRMNDTLEVQNDMSARAIALHEEKIANKKDQSSKYHGSLWKMIRFAGSIDGVDPLDDVPESAMRIFNCVPGTRQNRNYSPSSRRKAILLALRWAWLPPSMEGL
jgi:hypothetical protein